MSSIDERYPIRSAVEIAFARAQEEIKQLKSRIVELEELKTGHAKPAKAYEVKENKTLIRISGRK